MNTPEETLEELEKILALKQDYIGGEAELQEPGKKYRRGKIADIEICDRDGKATLVITCEWVAVGKFKNPRATGWKIDENLKVLEVPVADISEPKVQSTGRVIFGTPYGNTFEDLPNYLFTRLPETSGKLNPEIVKGHPDRKKAA